LPVSPADENIDRSISNILTRTHTHTHMRTYTCAPEMLDSGCPAEDHGLERLVHGNGECECVRCRPHPRGGVSERFSALGTLQQPPVRHGLFDDDVNPSRVCFLQCLS
jgi:hypothetical protein